MFDDFDVSDRNESEENVVWNGLLRGWLQAGPGGGEGPDALAAREADDLSKRLRRNGGRLPGSDPRR